MTGEPEIIILARDGLVVSDTPDWVFHALFTWGALAALALAGLLVICLQIWRETR
jgi:hypothetical protein